MLSKKYLKEYNIKKMQLYMDALKDQDKDQGVFTKDKDYYTGEELYNYFGIDENIIQVWYGDINLEKLVK